MQRRYFLRLAAALPLAALTGGELLLSGCGGVSGVSGSEGLGEVTRNLTMVRTPVAVKLPAGFAIPLGQLSLSNLYEDAPLSATGSAEILITSPTRALTFLNDTSGNPLLMGMVGPNQTELSVESTAQTLLYFALQQYLLPQELQGNALDALKASSQAATLAGEVSAALLRNPRALYEGDSALAAAVKSAAQSFDSQTTRSVNINPQTVKSGVELLNADNLNTISVANRWRLRKIVFVNKVSYTDQNGTEVQSTYPSYQKFELSPPKEVTGYFSAISDGFVSFFYNDAVSWVETRSNPVTLPVEPSTAQKTNYEVLVCGPGTYLGETARLTQTQANEWNDLVHKSFFLDFLLPFIINIGAGIGYFPGDAGKVSFGDVKFLEGLYTSVREELVRFLLAQNNLSVMIAKGNVFGAFTDFMYAFFNTDLFRNSLIPLFRKITEYILVTRMQSGNLNDTWLQAVKDEEKYKQVFTKATTALAKVLKVIAVIDIVLQAKDTLEQRITWGQAVAVERWTVDASGAKVSITPEDLIVQAGFGALLTAKIVEGNPEGGTSAQYEWSCGKGVFNDGGQLPAKKILTSKPTVEYVPGGEPGETDVITVNVTTKKANDIQPVGSASVKAYVTEFSVTPSAKSLKASETVTLSAELKGMRPLKTGETLTYKWLTTRTAGELLGSPDGGTTTPVETQTARYRAHASKTGVDTVTAEVFLNSRSLGKSTAKITVGSSIVEVEGRFEALGWLRPVTGSTTLFTDYEAGFVVVPIIEGAQFYTVRLSGDSYPFLANFERNFTYPAGAIELFPNWDGVSPILNGKAKTKTEFYILLRGGSNRTGSSFNSTAKDVEEGIAYWEAQFKGMVVEVRANL